MTVFLICPFVVNAQFNKGDKFLDVALLLNNVKNDGGYDYSTIRNIGVSPSIGFFISDNLALGSSFSYGSSYHSNDDTRNTGKSVSGGLFIKRFFTLNEKFLFLLKGGISYGRGVGERVTVPNSIFDYKSDFYFFGANIIPSFVFFPSPKWGFEASVGGIGFDHRKRESINTTITNTNTTNTFSILGGSISFGVNYYLRKKVDQ